VLKKVTFEELKSGAIEVEGVRSATVPLTSYTMSLEVADTLKEWIQNGSFTLTEPQEAIVSE
jgi:uncharacterized protein (DUF39 family)